MATSTTRSNGSRKRSEQVPASKHLGEAGEHLRGAALAGREALRSAAGAAREEIESGSGAVREELGEAAGSGRQAARSARAAADRGLHDLADRGRGLLDQTGALIRERPLAALGTAVVAGYLLARFTRRH